MVKHGSLCVLLFAGLGVAAPVMAFAPHGHGIAGLKGEVVLRPTLKTTENLVAESLGLGVAVEADALTNAPRLVSAKRFHGVADVAPSAGVEAYEDAARQFVADAASLVGIDSRDMSIVRDATLLDADVQFIDFAVKRDGLPVVDANVAFRFKRGRLLQVQLQSFAEAPADKRPSHPNVELMVRAEINADSAVQVGEAFRVVEVAGAYQLVRVALIEARQGDLIADVQAVAATGEIYQAVLRNRFVGGDAAAMVYARTWFGGTTAAQPLSEATLSVSGANLTTGLDGTFDATAAPRLFGFKGPRVSVTPKTGTAVVKDAVAREGGFELIVADTAEKNLSQAMAFHHVNAVVNYAKRYISTSWFDRQLKANVNLSQTCNAYWDGSTINFFSAGGGCANTALVSDVVYHEWGHGLDANTGGISDGAYSEGFGDIVSMLLTRDNVLAPGFKNNGSGIRDLAPNKIYPQDRGEVHAEGLIIGGTFWDLYGALTTKYDADKANDLVSAYAFKTIFTARRYTDVYNALLVVDDDDGDLTNHTPNFCEINAAFTAHGLSTASADCI